MPSSEISTDYLILLLQTQFMQRRFGADTRTLAQPTLNINLIRQAVTPVPPRAEQKRIVERYYELRFLFNRLRGELAEAEYKQHQVAQAVVEASVE